MEKLAEVTVYNDRLAGKTWTAFKTDEIQTPEALMEHLQKTLSDEITQILIQPYG